MYNRLWMTLVSTNPLKSDAELPCLSVQYTDAWNTLCDEPALWSNYTSRIRRTHDDNCLSAWRGQWQCTLALRCIQFCQQFSCCSGLHHLSSNLIWPCSRFHSWDAIVELSDVVQCVFNEQLSIHHHGTFDHFLWSTVVTHLIRTHYINQIQWHTV